MKLSFSRSIHMVGVAALLAASLQTAADAQSSNTYPRPSTSAYPTREMITNPLPPVSSSGETVRVDLAPGGSTKRMLDLPRGKSAIIELPVDARDVLVSDPKVADVILHTPRRVSILGVGAGQTDAVIFDGAGHQLLNLNIRVDQDTSALVQTLTRVLGDNAIHVDALNSSLILSGQVKNAAEADKAVRIAQSLVDKPEQVLNMLSVAGKDQVMLQVRIVEVDRSSIKQLGVDLNAIINQIGQPQYSLATAATYGVNGALLGGLTGGYKFDSTQQPELQVPCAAGITGTCYAVVRNATQASNYNTATSMTTAGSTGVGKASAMLQAFERVGLVRTLAEPNLTAVSGESAKFLAGGEFPVPVGHDNTGNVTIEFKQFGVGLGFTPVVLSDGRISLKISTEYSELSDIGSFTLTSSSTTSSGATTTAPSVSIPGLSVRKAETMVELPDGGAMMIAGLLSSTTKQTIDSLPGLTELPVLGALFRSRDFLNNESELVVIVTPYLVKPGRPDQMQTPADGLQIASDLDTVLLGRLNRASGHPAPAPDKTYQGPFGYVVD